MEPDLLRSTVLYNWQGEKISNIMTEKSSMFSVHWKSLYQSIKELLCPNRSRCSIVLISVETDCDPGNEISVFHSFSPLAQRPWIWAFRAFKPHFWLKYKFLWYTDSVSEFLMISLLTTKLFLWFYVTKADPDTHKPRRWKASSSPKVIYVAYIATMFAKHNEQVN